MTPAQRHFLTLVTRAAACNPFSDEFAELQAQIIGGKNVTLAERWNAELHQLQAAGLTDFKQAEGEDREILRYACLYEAV